MFRAFLLWVGIGLLPIVSTVAGEADYLKGKWTAYVVLDPPSGGAELGEIKENALVIGSKVSPPKQTLDDWLTICRRCMDSGSPTPWVGTRALRAGRVAASS